MSEDVLTITGLIAVLQEILAKDGDLPIVVWDDGEGYAISRGDVTVETQNYSDRLPRKYVDL